MSAYDVAAKRIADNPEAPDLSVVRTTIRDLKELTDEITRLRESLTRIAEHTDPESPEENYRADDREGCLDTVFAIARKALSGEDAA